MRTVRISPALAEALGKLVASRGGSSDPARLRLEDLEAVEKELGLTLPDPAIAYLVAGISVWGDGPVAIRAVRERTLTVLDRREEWGDEPLADRLAVIDDDSNGNYIGVARGDLWFLDHEIGYMLEGPVIDLVETVNDELERRGGEDLPFTAFAVELYSQPDPEPAEIQVRHPKFGRGVIIAEAGDVVTVRFDSAGEKKLKRSFLNLD